MKRLLLGLSGLLLAGLASASGPSIRDRVEGSMVVTGTITVAPDGTVGGYTLDRPERITPVAAEVIGKNRTGKVSDAVAEQVNLRVIAGDAVLRRWRKLFARSSTAAARQWTFAPAMPDDPEPYRFVRIPIVYGMPSMGTLMPDTYGQWIGYVPGPIEPVPWLDADKMLTRGSDSLAEDGGIYGKPSLSLRTPLDRS